MKFKQSLLMALLIPSITTANTSIQHKNRLEDLYDKIKFNGMITGAGYLSNTTPNTVIMLPNPIGNNPAASDLSLRVANLTATAQLADWMKTQFQIAYEQLSPSFIRSPNGGGDNLILDKAYVTFMNAKSSPLFLTIGRKFIDFGGLDFSSFLESPTQLLSLTRRTVLSGGFLNWRGFSGSAYLFRGNYFVNSPNTTRGNTYGLTVGFEQTQSALTYGVGAGYINNMINALYIQSTTALGSLLANGQYTHKVSGLDLHAMVKYYCFDASLKYIAALNSFAIQDLPFTQNGGLSFIGAKPAGWGVNLGYRFQVNKYDSRWAIGYQGSKEAAALGQVSGSSNYPTPGIYGTAYAIGMPKIRYYTNYDFHITKWLDILSEVDRDQGYSLKNGGTGKKAYTALVALTAQF